VKKGKKADQGKEEKKKQRGKEYFFTPSL